jgi:hypothetical protein
LGSSLNEPFIALVTVFELTFSTLRITIHKWLHCLSTANVGRQSTSITTTKDKYTHSRTRAQTQTRSGQFLSIVKRQFHSTLLLSDRFLLGNGREQGSRFYLLRSQRRFVHSFFEVRSLQHIVHFLHEHRFVNVFHLIFLIRVIFLNFSV